MEEKTTDEQHEKRMEELRRRAEVLKQQSEIARHQAKISKSNHKIERSQPKQQSAGKSFFGFGGGLASAHVNRPQQHPNNRFKSKKAYNPVDMNDGFQAVFRFPDELFSFRF